MPALTRRIVIACGVACSFAIASHAYAQDKDKKKKGDSKDQAQASKCDIDINSPAEMFSSALYMRKANEAKTDTAEQNKNWKAAINSITGSGYKNSNPAGLEYIISQGLVIMGTRPGAAPSAPRSTYGYKDNPTGTMDPLAVADSLLTQLLAAKPACSDVVASIRELGYVPLYNGGARALQAGQNDSAKAVAGRAIVISPTRPEAYNLVAAAALKEKDNTTAIANYKKVIETSGTDTLFAKTRSGALYNLGAVLQNQADTAKGDQKKDFAKQAADAWTQYLQTNPNDADAKAALARAQQAAGDTAAVTAAYADMINNPSKYTDLQLFQAGITASRAGRDKDADKLFNAGLEINPYFRDAVYYIAAGYFNAKDQEKLFPLARRLVDLDPNNADNWRLLAGAYQLRANGEKAQVPRKADVDSTMRYFNKGKDLPLQLRVNKFAKEGDKVTISGTLENKGTTAKSVTIKFQLIDKGGQPLLSQDVPVQVEAGATKPFDFTATQANVSAYKYAPIE